MASKSVYPFGPHGQLPAGYPIADDLETAAADVALSAKQGVILKELIDTSTLVEKPLELLYVSGALGNYINMTSNVWKSSETTKAFFLPIKPGHRYGLVAGSAQARYALLQNNTNTVDSAPAYATGETSVRTVSAGATKKFVAPDDAYYISINKTVSGSDILPVKLIEYLEEEDARIEYVDEKIAELRGTFNNQVVFNDLEVLSNDTSKITITKDADGGIYIYNKESSSGKYALIGLPSSLISGEKYTVSFKYLSGFNKTATWWLGFVGSDYQPTSGGVNLASQPKETIVRFSYTHNASNMYLRLASTSQNSGATVYIKEFSISTNNTTVSSLSTRVKTLEESSGSSQMDSLIRQARFVANEPTAQSLTLLHFSDIHGDSIAAGTIQKFYNAHASQIDDMVQTGDTVYYYWDSEGQGYQWFQDIGLPQSLFVMGNHDGAANDNSHGWKEGSADWDFKGKEWDFDTYFANYITSRGITPPVGYDDPNSPYYKALYWHKDYPNAKIRIIGLDCMHFNDGVRYTSNDQETWLAARLADTLNSSNAAYGYSVVFLCHYPLDDYSGNNETWNEETHKFVYNQNETGGHVMQRSTNLAVALHSGSSYTAEARFSMRNRVGTVGSTSYTKGNDNPIADVIKAWMDRGGKFVVWLSGHTHTEYMYYPAKYPNMLCMGIPQAGNTRGDNNADRSNTSAEHTCANLIVIDTQNTLLKVVRVGKTLNKYFFDQSKLCYNYSNKSVYNR